MVSVIIVAYNGRAYLDANLSSLMNELGPDSEITSEIIVVDNASMDGGAAFIQQAFPGVRLQKNAENIGFAPACNQGAALAQGECLVFLNQDTRVAPGWLHALVEPLNADNEVGLTTSKVLLMSDPSRHHLAGQNVHFTGLVFGRGYLDPASMWDEPADVNAVSGASFAISRELWQELGGFDETFFMYYEETDLSWRAQLAGYRCCYVPGSVVYHDYHPNRHSPSQLYHAARNRYLMLLKNWRWTTLVLLLPGILLAEIIEWSLALAYRGLGIRAKFRANWWLLKHFGVIRQLHSRTQRLRTESELAILRHFSYRLEPRTITGGELGFVVVTACNALLALNYHLAIAWIRLAGT